MIPNAVSKPNNASAKLAEALLSSELSPLSFVNRFVRRIANQLDGVARRVGDVDAFGAVAMRVNRHARFSSSHGEGVFVHTQGDVRRMLRRRDQSEFALPQFQEGPSFVLIQNGGAEVFDVK